MPPSREDWHLDKKVPIGLIIGLVVQTIVITAVGATKFESLDNRVGNLEKSDTEQASHEGRITILEQKFDYIRSDLADIKLTQRSNLEEIKELLRRPFGDKPQQ